MTELHSCHKTLYDELLHLTATNEAFYFRDNIKDDVTYRIFTYRLASYTDFLLPSALECRGIMFEVANDLPVRLASRPMAKFFNYKENPLTMDIDFHGFQQIMYKMDGSLISTFQHKGEVFFKSKTALYSEHAIAATAYAMSVAPSVCADADTSLYDEFKVLERAGYTINCEFTSPDYPFRIVVGYQETKLTVLNVRNRESGKYLTLPEVHCILNYYYGNCNYRCITDHWIETIHVEDADIDTFVEAINGMVNIEGFVIQLDDGQLVKIKTDWYRALHHVKDSINCMRRLFEAVLEETTDDLRSMLYDDPISLNRINEMEVKVVHIYNSIVNNVERFYESHIHMDRKEYAIAGQKELTHMEFGLAMNKYVGKPVDYKATIKKNYKAFGIEDNVIETED